MKSVNSQTISNLLKVSKVMTTTKATSTTTPVSTSVATDSAFVKTKLTGRQLYNATGQPKLLLLPWLTNLNWHGEYYLVVMVLNYAIRQCSMPNYLLHKKSIVIPCGPLI